MNLGKLAPIGYVFDLTSKEGGGKYTIIGHINCERCDSLCEDREWTEPSRKHRKKGKYYSHYYWCENCGLYVPDLKSLEIINT